VDSPVLPILPGRVLHFSLSASQHFSISARLFPPVDGSQHFKLPG
jgi:hypothetical protein